MADQESHLNPLTNNKYHNPPRNQEKSSKCLVYILIFVVLQSIILFIFGLVVLRVKSPQVQLSHIAVQNLHYETVPPASLSATMDAEIQVYNQNFGSFKFHNSNTTLLYQNITVGVANIYGERVAGRKRNRMNVSLQAKANKLLPDYNLKLSSDIDSGLVKLSSHAKLRGEVRLLKIIRWHRTAGMNCTMSLNLTSQEIQDLLCQRS